MTVHEIERVADFGGTLGRILLLCILAFGIAKAALAALGWFCEWQDRREHVRAVHARSRRRVTREDVQ